MKKICFLLLSAFYSMMVFSQTDSLQPASRINSPSVPEFVNQPFYLDKIYGRLVKLERPRVHTGINFKGQFVEVDSSKSFVRVGKADTTRFIVRVSAGTDPRDLFELIAFTIKNGKRRCQVTGTKGLALQDKYVYKKIDYELRKAGEGVYILLVNSLPPGEYYFASHDGAFAFGID